MGLEYKLNSPVINYLRKREMISEADKPFMKNVTYPLGGIAMIDKALNDCFVA